MCVLYFGHIMRCKCQISRWSVHRVALRGDKNPNTTAFSNSAFCDDAQDAHRQKLNVIVQLQSFLPPTCITTVSIFKRLNGDRPTASANLLFKSVTDKNKKTSMTFFAPSPLHAKSELHHIRHGESVTEEIHTIFARCYC